MSYVDGASINVRRVLSALSTATLIHESDPARVVGPYNIFVHPRLVL